MFDASESFGYSCTEVFLKMAALDDFSFCNYRVDGTHAPRGVPRGVHLSNSEEKEVCVGESAWLREQMRDRERETKYIYYRRGGT